MGHKTEFILDDDIELRAWGPQRNRWEVEAEVPAGHAAARFSVSAEKISHAVGLAWGRGNWEAEPERLHWCKLAGCLSEAGPAAVDNYDRIEARTSKIFGKLSPEELLAFRCVSAAFRLGMGEAAWAMDGVFKRCAAKVDWSKAPEQTALWMARSSAMACRGWDPSQGVQGLPAWLSERGFAWNAGAIEQYAFGAMAATVAWRGLPGLPRSASPGVAEGWSHVLGQAAKSGQSLAPKVAGSLYAGLSFDLADMAADAGADLAFFPNLPAVLKGHWSGRRGSSYDASKTAELRSLSLSHATAKWEAAQMRAACPAGPDARAAAPRL